MAASLTGLDYENSLSHAPPSFHWLEMKKPPKKDHHDPTCQQCHETQEP